MPKSLAFLFLLFFQVQIAFSQVLLDADGPGNTYSLITSVLAPGNNPIETPDCSHNAFGDHIDEVFDEELDINVFRFHIHTTPDDDRCINFDRQRNEIKSYGGSPDNLLGIEDETVVYKWKFRLEEGFQTSPNFTHLHQLKSVGGDLASMPMYTLTARKSNPDRLELRYAETDTQITLLQTGLAPFIGTWLEVTETIKYGMSGTYAIEIKQVSDGAVLFEYENESIINWRPDADFVRPKWGIYRSLLNAQDLRNETVLFANFSIEETITSTSGNALVDDEIVVFPNPVKETLYINSLPVGAKLIRIFNLDGRKVIDEMIDSETQINLDVSSLVSGSYIVTLTGASFNYSKLFFVLK